MTWEPTLPADNSKIRNLGTEIRPNWEAIQEGNASFLPQALNLKNRTLLSPTPANPTAISGSYILFSKEDAVSGIPELFGINKNSNVTQFTNGTQTLDPITGSASLGNGLIIKWGTVSPNLAGVNVTYPTAFPTAGVSVQLTAIAYTGTATTAIATPLGTNGKTGFTALVSHFVSVSFSYIAIGY